MGTARRVLTGVVLAAFLTSYAWAGGDAALTGTWTLDRRESDDPERVLRDGERGGGFGSRVARGVSIFGIPVGSLPRPERTEKDEEHLEEAVRGIDHVFETTYRLVIRQEEGLTEIRYGTEPTLQYRHDAALERDGVVSKAKWQGGVLEIEHELANGGRATERYSIDRRSGDLHWTVCLKPRREDAVDIERVLFRAPGGAP